DEDAHLDHGLHAQALEDRRPGEQEDALDVEDHEQEGVDVIANLGLGPALADGVDPTLVGGELLGELAAGGDDPGCGEGHGDQSLRRASRLRPLEPSASAWSTGSV